MQIRAGYEIVYECPQPTPMILMLTVHPSRQPDLITPHRITFEPAVVAHDYLDSFGNACTRIVAPAGRIAISSDFVIRDSGAPDPVAPEARAARRRASCPTTCCIYLLGSRYCDTDHLTNTAWSLFGNTPTGWARVQAICDYVHEH